MEELAGYGLIVLLAIVAAWQAVCVVVWLWDKVRKPVGEVEAKEKPEEMPEAVRKGLERIARESVGENRKGA